MYYLFKQIVVGKGQGTSSTPDFMDSPTSLVFSARTLQAKIEIEGILFNGFIDPGSEISIIRLVAFNKLLELNKSLSLTPTHIRVTVANDSPMVVLGVVPLQCCWFGTSRSFTLQFFVSDIRSTDLLLGIDLLDSQRSILDVSGKWLRFKGETSFHVPLEAASSTAQMTSSRRVSTNLSLCVHRTTVVPTLHEVMIQCEAESPLRYPDGTVLFVEPNEKFRESHSLLVAHSLVTVSDNRCFVRLMNVLPNDIVLYKGCRIAYCSRFVSDALVHGVTTESSSPHHVHPDLRQFLLLPSHLSVGQKKKIWSSLTPYASIFSQHQWDLGHTTVLKHKIRLQPDAKPVKLPYRGMNPHKKRDLKEKIDNLQKAGLIEPTHSEWAAPTILVGGRKTELSGWSLTIVS